MRRGCDKGASRPETLPRRHCAKRRLCAQAALALRLHRSRTVAGIKTVLTNREHAYAGNERRGVVRNDRRKHSRSGRRTSDPHTNWQRIAWLFAAYALYLSVRALPATVKNLFKRTETPA